MRAWWFWGSVPARMFLKLDEAIDTGEFLMAHSDPDGTVYRLDYGDSDGGDLITCFWQTLKHDMDDHGIIKKFYKIVLDFEDVAGGVQVDWAIDNDTASGTFTAQKRGQYWYGSATNPAWLYNNAAGSQNRGAFYTTRKAGRYVFDLPQEAMGGWLQVTLTSICGIPFQLNAYEIHFDYKEQLYPDSEV